MKQLCLCLRKHFRHDFNFNRSSNKHFNDVNDVNDLMILILIVILMILMVFLRELHKEVILPSPQSAMDKLNLVNIY